MLLYIPRDFKLKLDKGITSSSNEVQPSLSNFYAVYTNNIQKFETRKEEKAKC